MNTTVLVNLMEFYNMFRSKNFKPIFRWEYNFKCGNEDLFSSNFCLKDEKLMNQGVIIEFNILKSSYVTFSDCVGHYLSNILAKNNLEPKLNYLMVNLQILNSNHGVNPITII